MTSSFWILSIIATSTKLFFSKNSWKALEVKDNVFSFSGSSPVIFLFILDISLKETRNSFAMSLNFTHRKVI
jgi:hypothetical protein